MHYIWWVHLLSCQHLLRAVTQRRPNCLTAVDARRRHALLSRHRHEAALHQVASGLAVQPLIAGTAIDVLHGHGAGLLNRWGALRPMILLK